jgi:hypothetical protein
MHETGCSKLPGSLVQSSIAVVDLMKAMLGEAWAVAVVMRG